MELEEYITHLQGFSEGLYGRGLQEMILPAAEHLYAGIKSRTNGVNDTTNTPGYYDAAVAKRQTFSQANKNQKLVNVKPVNISRPVAGDFKMEVDQDKVVLGLTQKVSDKRRYYATAQELEGYTKDVRTGSEELSYKLLKGE